MANNRMYIKCCACGKEMFLAKRMIGAYYTMGNGWYESMHGKGYLELLEDFFEEHEWCGDSLDHYAISYEDESEVCLETEDEVDSSN